MVIKAQRQTLPVNELFDPDGVGKGQQEKIQVSLGNRTQISLRFVRVSDSVDNLKKETK